MKLVQTKTSDGIYFKGLISEPLDKTDTIIIHVHGMSGDFYNNAFYPAMHSKYPENGIAFLAGENRGSCSVMQFNSDSGVKNIGNAYEIFEECVLDIQAWIDFAKSRGYTKIWLQGHSLGPSKIVHYVATQNSSDISGLILISPSDIVGLVHDPDDQKDFDILYPEAKQLVASGKQNELLSHVLWGDILISAKTFLNFFEEPTNTAIFNYARPDLGWKKVNDISVPVLAITGTKDIGITRIIDPYEAMKILISNLSTSPKVETVVFENAEHSFDDFGDHIVSTVVKFVKD